MAPILLRCAARSPNKCQKNFSEINHQSIRALVQHVVAIGNALKKELPFDYLSPSWHIEDGTNNCTVGIFARWGQKRHSLMIYTHYLDAPPEPKGMHPPDCCVVGTLQVSPSDPVRLEALEACGTPERWKVGAAVSFLRRIPDGYKSEAPRRHVERSMSTTSILA